MTPTEATERYNSNRAAIDISIAATPKGQKFPIGTRVRVADDLGDCMTHFISSCNATVVYTYKQMWGGEDVTSYCLDIDGHGECAWYKEHQLCLI